MKILIVDDEARHRRGMRSLIRSLRPGGQVMEAGDGQSALQLIREDRPDVVLTDIRMPTMDGLEFLRILEHESAKPKVVMISAYDRFEYAQTAIRHGAYDYLLKPVDADKVEQLLGRIEGAIREEVRQQTESDTMRRQLSETSEAYRSRRLLSWLHGVLGEDERQEVEQLGWLHGGGVVVLTELQSRRDQSRDSMAAELLGELQRIGGSCGTGCALLPDGPPGPVIELVSLVRWTGSASEGMARLRQELEHLTSTWGAAAEGVRHSIGLAPQSLWDEAAQAYQQARAVSSYHFYDWESSVLVENEHSPLPDKGSQVDSEALLEALQEGTPDKALRLCAGAFERLAGRGRRSPADLKEHASLLLMKIKSRSRAPVDRRIGHALSHAAVAEVPACRTFRELMEVLEMQLLALHQVLHAGRGDRDQELADQCVKWIEDHLQELVTLEQAAERFFFNPSYFSTWIKHHTGKTFTEHLLEARMTRAAGLLADNRLKIYEIAAQCGYTDTKYFCRVFKRRFGLSPEAHRHAALLQGREGT